MKKFFRDWADLVSKGKYISVRQFDNLIGMLRGWPPEQCGLSGKCTPQFVVEADGRVYPCDFYALDRYCCGNVWEQNVEEILTSAGIKNFAQDQIAQGPLCADCPVRAYCGGGCKRYRNFYYSEVDYCPYQDFLMVALPILRQLI